MSATTSKNEAKRRAPGGIGITMRGEKFEATYNIPKDQLPVGAPRKRITAWGESEASAISALMKKRQLSTTTPLPAEELNEEQEGEMDRRLGSDGVLAEGEYYEHPTRQKTPTLNEWVEEWKEDWIDDSLQESTRRIYFGHIRDYILPYIGQYPLNDLTPKILKRQWLVPISALRKVKNGVVSEEPLLGESALANVHKTLRKLLITAYHKHGTHVSLSQTLFPMPQQERPESDSEVIELTAKLRKLIIDEPDKENPYWSLFALSLVGLRQAERLGICLSDIDLRDRENPVIYVKHQLAFLKSKGGWYLKKETKNGQIRPVPLWGVFLEAVEKQLAMRKEWQEQDDWNPDPAFADLLFLQPGGKLWTRRQDTPAWHQYVGPGIRGHLARHATAHILAEQGISSETAGLLLGHMSDAYRQYYRSGSFNGMGNELREAEAKSKTQAPKKKNRRLYMVESN